VPTPTEVEAAVDAVVLDYLDFDGGSLSTTLELLAPLIHTGPDTLPVVPRWTRQSVKECIDRLTRRGLVRAAEGVERTRKGEAILDRLNGDLTRRERSAATMLARGMAVRWPSKATKKTKGRKK
jgi:hypothetical protein